MYSNIGGKLKGLAKFMFCMGAISSGITGVFALLSNPIVGILVICIGFLVSWISSWMTYAVGEIADSSEAVLDRVDSLERKYQAVLHANAQGNMQQTNMQKQMQMQQPMNMQYAAPTNPVAVAEAPQSAPTINVDGSWTCPKCRRNNMASRNTCWSCDYVKQ